MRKEVIEERKEVRSAHASADSEKHKNINHLELKIVSWNFTIEEKGRMSDKIKFDLNRSESNVSRLVQQIRDHQDTINSLDEAAELKTLLRQAVLLRVTRHLATLAELQSQGKRVLAAIQTCPSAAIIKQEATLLRLLYCPTQFLFLKEL